MSDQLPINPYAPPASVDEHVLPPDVPPYRLFSVSAIVLGTFLGGLAGGGMLVLWNFLRLGRPLAGCCWAAAFTAGMLGIMTVSLFLPDSLPSVPVLLVQMGIAYGVAKALQEKLIAEHELKGGERASMWWAAGLSILAGVLVTVVFLGVVMFLPESWFIEEEGSMEVAPWPE